MKQYRLNQTVVNALPAEIAVLDPEGRVIAANESWDGLCGLPPGVDYLSFRPQASGLSDAEMRHLREGVQAVLHGEQTEFSMDYCQESPAGKRWLRLACTPLGRDGWAVLSPRPILLLESWPKTG